MTVSSLSFRVGTYHFQIETLQALSFNAVKKEVHSFIFILPTYRKIYQRS